MKIITSVQGIVNPSRTKEFEESFAAVKMEPLPDGFVTSTLSKNVKETETYRIQTVWKSMEALEKMRSTTKTPKAVELFQRVGAEPKVEVYQVIDSIP